MSIQVLLKPLHPKVGHEIPLPQGMSEDAAGWDVRAALDSPVTLDPGAYAAIPCGFAMALPSGYECQVRPRSGLAAKHGVTVLNAPGTIDADYRGEVKVLLINHGREAFCIEPGERVAQLVFSPVQPTVIQAVAELDDTERGAGGFGSTGAA